MIVEDDEMMRDIFSEAFRNTEFMLHNANSGASAKSQISSSCPDIILLDLVLPDISGKELLKWIRSWSNVAVVVVSSKNNPEEKADLLSLGADDYVTKPFSFIELVARARTALRHSDAVALRKGSQDDIIVTDGLEIDISRRKLVKNGHEIRLTSIEQKIFWILAKNMDSLISYGEIMTQVWGPYVSEDNRILRVNMSSIRKKLGKKSDGSEYIITENGCGYRLK